MDVTRVREIREEMERAEARRLQPHFIASFFIESFTLLGGSIHEREKDRYEIKHVPAVIRNRDREIGRSSPVLQRYERITFHKDLISVAGKPMAAFVCPGHPLLDATLDLVIERHRDLLKRGTILIDDNDQSQDIRAMLYLEHSIQDARSDRSGNRRVVSKRLQFVEVFEDGRTVNAGPAPYLNYRPPTDAELESIGRAAQPSWVRGNIESKAMEHAAINLVPAHLQEVKARKESLIDKTRAAVQERLTKEINYWDHRATTLKDQELAGQVNARLNSGKARERADDLTGRLQKRLLELDQERKLSPLPPIVLGGAMVVPIGCLKGRAESGSASNDFILETDESERRAMQSVMDAERSLGFVPRDVSDQNGGYDIESSIPNTGLLRFIEVKGRVHTADSVTVTKNEILTGLNKPEDFILAIVLHYPERSEVRYVRTPFDQEPDFQATSVNYNLNTLLKRSQGPT